MKHLWIYRLRKYAILISLLLVVGGVFSYAVAEEQQGTASIIVKMKAGLSATEQASVIAANGGMETSSVPALRLHVIEVPANELSTFIVKYQSDPRVQHVEENKTRKVDGVPSDPEYVSQWALPKIGWDQVFGNLAMFKTVKVAVLDTGVKATHEDLAGKVIAGASFVDGSTGLSDAHGHGTWMSGIIAANTDNALGIAGVAFSDVRIIPVKVIGADGLGQDSDIISGVIWAADHGADVILMGFSNPDFSANLQDAIDYAWSKDIVLVAAAGNDGISDPTFPAGDRGVIGVSATDSSDNIVSFSNYGKDVFLAAPGAFIETTGIDRNNPYVFISGTSPAAAIVAGAAAVMRANDPTLSNGVIVGRLARTTDSLEKFLADSDFELKFGNGRINLARALADTNTEEIQPAGVAPVGNGGPYVGPYKVAARNLTINISGGGGGNTVIFDGTSYTAASTVLSVANNTDYNVYATLAPGYMVTWSFTFTDGKGTFSCDGSHNLGPCTLNMEARDQTLTATFATCTPPSAPTAGSNSPVCTGSTLNLTATTISGATYIWTGPNGFISTSQNPSITSVTTAAAGTYYVQAISGSGCSSSQGTTTVTVNAATPGTPTGVSADSATICNGSSTNLNGTVEAGATLHWYTDGCGTTSVGTGTGLSVSPTTTTTYYARAENTCGNSAACATVTVTVNDVPGTPTGVSADSTTICNGSSTNLNGTVEAGATLHWYTGSCGGTPVGTGSPLSVSPTTTTTYYARAENTCGNSACATVTVKVSLVVPHKPTGVSADSTTICNGGSTNLRGNVDEGSTLHWYTDSCGGTSVGTGSGLSVSPTTTTTYYARAENACGNSSCATVTVTVSTAVPGTPTGVSADSTTICNGGSTNLNGTVEAGATLQWYTDGCGTTSVGTGSPLSVFPTTTTTYYARAENACGNSSCATVTVTVSSAVPGTPTGVSADSTTICNGSSTNLNGTVEAGATLHWYTDGCGTTSVGTGSPLSVSPTTTTTYYARAENTCGNSSCAEVTVTVSTAVPETPGRVEADPSFICNGDHAYLSADVKSATLHWYTDSCGGTPVGTGIKLSVSPTTTTTYYARAENACGNSSCATVTVTVSTAVPGAPTGVSADSTTICNGGSTNLNGTVEAGATLHWYTDSCDGTPVGTGSPLSVSPTTTTTYYARAENACGNSSCATVTVTVNDVPGTPTGVSASSPTICNGGSTNLNGTVDAGATLHWYTGSCGGTPVGTGTGLSVSPTTTTTYYARAESTCGNSSCATVTVTVNDVPGTPTGVSASSTTICNGGSTNLNGTVDAGATLHWYTGSCGGTPVGTGTGLSVSPTTTTTYYARAENTCGNSSCATVTVTVNDIPGTPTGLSATPSTICSGQSSTLAASVAAGATLHWYTDSCDGTPVGTGTGLSVSPTTTTTYYARAENTCGNSSCDQVTVTISTAAPGTPTSVTASKLSICSGESTNLTGSVEAGATLHWYTGSCGGTSVGTGTGLSVSPTTTTTYYARAENTCGNSSCETVTVTVKATPTVTVSGGPFIYDGNPHAATVSVTGAGGVVVAGSSTVTYTGTDVVYGPSTTPPTNVGTYSVDVSFTSSDSGYCNATGSGSITIVNCSDLTGAWSSLRETRTLVRGKYGYNTDGTFGVKNLSVTPSGFFTVSFYLSNDGVTKGTLMKWYRQSPLKRGYTVSLNIHYVSTVSLKGKYVVAVIDSGNEVIECSETNNTFVRQIQ